MSLSKKPYRGTRDFFPKEKRIQDYIFSKMHLTSQSFGYEHYDGPLLEEVELYKAKSGEELINDQIYSFTDRGERFVAIRPEMTPTLARMVSQVHRELPKPIRWYSIPNLMRYEKPQKGRLREHWQLNCDVFGSPGEMGTLEILQVAITLMENFGANEKHFEILINDRRIVDEIFTNIMKLNKESIYKLYKIIDKSKKVSRDALEKMVSELNLGDENQKTFYQYIDSTSFEDIFKLIGLNGNTDCTTELKGLQELLSSLEIEKYVKYDPTIVRGLDYYTGVVFEIFDKNPENRRALCGGGAYANLLSIFNETPVPGVGFGLGDVTLTDFLQTHNLLPNFERNDIDLLITYQTEQAKSSSLKLARDLRKLGMTVSCSMEATKFKKVFDVAAKLGAKYVTLCGENELKVSKIQIKNIETKENKEIEISNTQEIKEFIH